MQSVYSYLLYPNVSAEHIQRHKHLSWMFMDWDHQFSYDQFAMFMHTLYSGRNYRRQIRNGSILAEEIFYILAPRNIWKLILFFS